MAELRFDRVSVDPGKMGGVPCIRGLRIPVSVIASAVAAGVPTAQILSDYPDLTAEDVHQAVAFAAAARRLAT